MQDELGAWASCGDRHVISSHGPTADCGVEMRCMGETCQHPTAVLDFFSAVLKTNFPP